MEVAFWVIKIVAVAEKYGVLPFWGRGFKG